MAYYPSDGSIATPFDYTESAFYETSIYAY